MTREYHMLSSPASHHTHAHNMSIHIMTVAAVLRAIHVHKNTWPDIVNVVLNMHVRIFSWTLLFQFWIVKSEDRIVRKTTSDLPCFQLCFLILYPKRSVSKCRLTRRNYLIVKSNKNHMSWYVKCIWILKICDLLKTLFGWLPTNRQPTSGDVGTLGRSDFLQVDGGPLGEVELSKSWRWKVQMIFIEDLYRWFLGYMVNFTAVYPAENDHISPYQSALLSRWFSFLFRWDTLIPWRVHFFFFSVPVFKKEILESTCRDFPRWSSPTASFFSGSAQPWLSEEQQRQLKQSKAYQARCQPGCHRGESRWHKLWKESFSVRGYNQYKPIHKSCAIFFP